MSEAIATTTRLATRATRVLRTHVLLLGVPLGIMWTVGAINWMLDGLLAAYGVIPRSSLGLRGVVFAPFIHGNWNHLAANSVPFLTLGWLILLRETRHFIPITLLTMLGAGAGAWFFGAPGSVHIGASGVIFGYLGFLMVTGVFDRSILSILLSILVTAVWGGLAQGVMPGTPGVSWQAHLGGFVGGVLAAYFFRTARRSKSR
jgi:membrane associated rhomboid family serine protease